ncbi:hypothetical protein GCM10027347_39600 [Larkinella harenae]
MSLSKEEQFNEEWRNLFENAEESPSDELWDSIARRLDEEEAEPIIPLWPRVRPWVYGVAASVIALLVGWWATQSINTADLNRPVAGQTTGSPQTKTNADQAVAQDKTVAAAPEQSTNPATPDLAKQRPESGNTDQQDEALAQNHSASPGKRAAGSSISSVQKSSENTGTIGEVRRNQSVLASKNRTNAVPQASAGPERQPDAGRLADAHSPQRVSKSGSDRPTTPEQPMAHPEASPAGFEPVAETADTRLAYEAAYIKNKVTVAKAPRPISRIIWYRAPETTIEPQQPKESSRKEYWAALTATPMSFNPMASVQSRLGEAYSVYNGVMQSSRVASAATLQNQAQISMAWQASTGVQLNKHWSVEAGVQYLNGRSQTQNNASVTNAFTNQTESLLINAVRSSSPNASLAMDAPAPQNGNSFLPTGLDKNNLVNSSYLKVIPADQVVSNNFQYIQVPVNVGYHILPQRKISYSVLGGVMANVFLKNTISGSLEINPEDQVYRPTSLAGTAGLRVNYHPTHHWSGSLTGSYQQALQNGTQSDAVLQVRPQAIGVGFGLNYHF